MKIKLITVCVEYDDYLALTLPRNLERLGDLVESWTVVTSFSDRRTTGLCDKIEQTVDLHVTDAFYHAGAAFNKGFAIEQTFDHVGRSGWLCVMDADVLLPADVARRIDLVDTTNGREFLWTPQRRMCTDARMLFPAERWTDYPYHKPEEHAGYMQLFHADAPSLRGVKPWYGVKWTHAGGCDSDFAKHFGSSYWRRPAFDVMHLGPECRNWHGRCAPRLDGREIEQAATRVRAHDKLLKERGLPTHGRS